MEPFTITRKIDNSAYESRFAVNVHKDIHMLSFAISDNDHVNVMFYLDAAEMQALATYIREAVK